jgi:hypothetical protein
LVGWRRPGCIAPRSCVLAVDLPSVEVDSPKDFEVVSSSEIPTILRLPTSNLQIQLFSLLCFAFPWPVKFFWTIHKIIRFLGEVAVNLLLGLAINKI